jgi:hypothetical protein
VTGTNAFSHTVKNGAWSRRASLSAPPPPPTPPVDPPPAVIRPTGAGYVRYEDLYATGDTLQQVFQKVTGTHAGKVLTFPAGEFTWSNFKSPIGYHDGIRIPTTCRGVAGSGIGQTRFRMIPNSSTEGIYDSTTSGVNPLWMWFIDNVSNSLFQDFTFVGTEQGHHYNGLGIDHGPGAVVQRVKFIGANRGYANYPPGETFSLGLNHCNNVQVIDVECDNRDEVTGLRKGCSGVGFNNLSSPVVKRVYTHHGLAGMLTFWNITGGVTTEDIHTWTQGTNGGILSSCGINHENVTGPVRHTRPKLIIAGRFSDQKLTEDNGQHLGFGNSFADMPDCEIYDPIFDKNEHPSGCFSVMISDGYPSQKIVTMPKIYFNGVLAQVKDRNNLGSMTGITPSNAWIRYH